MRHRYIVRFRDRAFGAWVWAPSKRDARLQMQAYARCTGDKIVSVEQVF